jgi:hypothetical protein
MFIKGLLKNQSFTMPLVITGVFTVLYIMMNVFVTGGEEFYKISNALISSAAALATSILFFYATANKRDSASRSLWSLMAWGFGLWGLADTILAVYTIVLKNDYLPTPSIGDLFWIGAYIPFYIALILRLRTLKVKLERRQLWIILELNSAFAILATVFIIIPIIKSIDPSSLVEGVINLLYPLGDIGLVILASLILILLRQGRFSLIWRMIFGGIFIMTASDLVYYYAISQGTYMPGGHINAITILSDTTYTLAYVSAGLGMYMYRFIWNVEKSFQVSVDRPPEEKYSTFIGTDRDHRMVSVSNNFYCLVHGDAGAVYYRQKFNEVLGIQSSAWLALIKQIINNEIICHVPFTISPPGQKSQTIFFTAVATFNPGQEFTGANFVLTADIDVPADLRQPMTNELLRLTNHLLARAGSRPEDEIKAMQMYCLETVRLLSTMVYQFGGDPLRNGLTEELNLIAKKNNLPVEIEQQSIRFPEIKEAGSLAQYILPLLQSARNYAKAFIGAGIVNEEMQELEQQLSATMKRDLDKYQLRAY